MTAVAGDTWGISGPRFLVLYGAIFVVAVLAVLVARRVIRSGGQPSGGHRSMAQRIATVPTDVAFLNDGKTLALSAALSALHTGAAITVADRLITAVPGAALPAGYSPLERAVHTAAQQPPGIRRALLAGHPLVRPELAAIEQRLVTAGLLLTRPQRIQQRLVSLVLVPVFILGTARELAGIAADKPVGILDWMLIAVFAALFLLLIVSPRQTIAGGRVLATLKKEHAALGPKLKPNWRAYGPTGAALSVGVFGTAAIWAADPTFAAATGITGPNVSSGDRGSDGGSSGGGDGCGG